MMAEAQQAKRAAPLASVKDARYWSDALARDGYCIIPNLVSPAVTEGLHGDLADRLARTPFSQGDFYGARTKRCGALLKRSAHADTLVRHALVLEIAQAVLGPYCDCLQLNLTQAIQLHPGSPAQPPHRDHDIWRAPKGAMEFQINVMWPLTPFRADNGATVVWPGSHRRLDEMMLDPSESVAAEMEPGSALMFLGSVMHGGGANRSLQLRTGAIISYCLGWLKPYENQWLAYPPDVARHFPPELAGLVGYRQHLPNLGNYEGQCPSVLLRDAPPEFLGAVDALPPEHLQFLEMMKRQALQASA